MPRTIHEIQIAHDLLCRQKNNPKLPADLQVLRKMAMSALCWILEHDEPGMFLTVLKQASAEERESHPGFTLLNGWHDAPPAKKE